MFPGDVLPMRGFNSESESIGGMLERLDARADEVRVLMENSTVEDLIDLWNQLDVSAIYHDCALEGQVISSEELKTSFDPRAVTDATSFQLYSSLRAHRTAYELIRQLATARELRYDMALLKKFHAHFVSKPENSRNFEFRQDIPLHRSYFHEINEAGQIVGNMTKLLAWMNDPADQEELHPVTWATRFHYNFMRIFPFMETSGKIGRAIVNLVLVRQGYLPAVIHATERQRYYEALRQSQNGLTELVIDSARASLEAAHRYLTRNVVAP